MKRNVNESHYSETQDGVQNYKRQKLENDNELMVRNEGKQRRIGWTLPEQLK